MSCEQVRSDELDLTEGTTPRIVCEVQDQNGAPVQPVSLVLTLYDRDTEMLLGGRPAQQDIFNANGVTVAAGVVTWQMTVADNVIINDHKAVESHVALLEWTWADSFPTPRADKHEIVLMVHNLDMVGP